MLMLILKLAFSPLILFEPIWKKHFVTDRKCLVLLIGSFIRWAQNQRIKISGAGPINVHPT